MDFQKLIENKDINSMDDYKKDYEGRYGVKPPYYFELENSSDLKETKIINGSDIEKDFYQINIGLTRILVFADCPPSKMIKEILPCKIKTDSPLLIRTFGDYYCDGQFQYNMFQITRIGSCAITYKDFVIKPQTQFSFEIPPKMKFKIYIFPKSIEWKNLINSSANIFGTDIVLPKGIYKFNPEIEGWCCWQGLAHLYYDKISINDNEERKKEIAKEIIDERPDEFKKAVEWMREVSVLKTLFNP